MKIAIVGAGLAGVASAWHLLQKKGFSVDLYDPQGVAGGASGIASGLLHPFTGKHAQKAWRADEGMSATIALIEVAEKALGKNVCAATGILRPAVTEEQREDFSQRGEWWDAKMVQKKLPLAAPFPALWIPEGRTVFTSLYLQGVWLDCEKKGGKLLYEKVDSLEQLKGYDGVVLATGFETLQFPECAHLPLKKTAGQIVTCRWEEPLPFSLISHGHIALTEKPDLCRVGATYERGEHLSKMAVEELKQKAALFYPPVLDFEVVEIKSGIRISPMQGYKPIVEQIRDNIWVFTALGSKGMIYHALLAKQIAEVF